MKLKLIYLVFLSGVLSTYLSTKRNPFCCQSNTINSKATSKISNECYKLLAVAIVNDGRIAVATIQSSNGIKVYKKGDKIDIYTITSIKHDSIIFTSPNGKQKVIKA